MFLASADAATTLTLRLEGVGQRAVTLAAEITAPYARLTLRDIAFYRPAIRRFCDEVGRLRDTEAGVAALRSAQAGELELRVHAIRCPDRATLCADLVLRRGAAGHPAQGRFEAVFTPTPAALSAFTAGLRAALGERISGGLR